MSMHRFGIFVLLVTALAVGDPGAADDSVGGKTTIEERFKLLLQRDAQSQTNEKLRKVLEFYQSAGSVPESTWAKLEGQDVLAWIPTNDPLMLAKFVEIGIQHRPMMLSPDTKQFVEANQTETLTAAIRLTQNDFSQMGRMAADVLMQYRDRLTAEHWRTILEGRQYVIRHRDSYPAGIPASVHGYSLIPLGYVFLPDREARTMNTETKVYFDGKQKYPRGTKGLGWRAGSGYVGFGRLPVGCHSLQLRTTYEFKLGDVAITGINASAEYSVEITAANTPDHLAADVDEQLIAQVEASVIVGSRDEAREFTYSRPVGDGKFEPIAKVVVPAIKVTEPLPVGLCMKPEIYVEGEDKPLTRLAWIVPAGKTTAHILEDWAGDSQLRKLLMKPGDSEERIRAKLILRPSRKDALSDPSIKKYYPRVIEREIEFRGRKIDADESG